MTKRCSKCHRELPIDRFPPNRHKGPDARTSWCRDCRNASARERWRRLHPEARVWVADTEPVTAAETCRECGKRLNSYQRAVGICCACEDREVAALVDREIAASLALAEAERRRMERYALAVAE